MRNEDYYINNDSQNFINHNIKEDYLNDTNNNKNKDSPISLYDDSEFF